MNTLYSTNCPKCRVLETKMKQHNIPYEVNSNIDDMTAIGMMSAPGLRVDENPDKVMTFNEAIEWIKSKSQEDKA